MNVLINLGNKKSSLKTIAEFKENEYVPFDVQVTNSHITDLNELIGKKIFKKETLYINSYTLWEIMQPVGEKGNHNYHGLTEEDVLMGLCSIKNPRSIFVSKFGRYAFITTELSHYGHPLMLVLEVGVGTKEDTWANVNKIITIYPKDNVEALLKALDEECILLPPGAPKMKK